MVTSASNLTRNGVKDFIVQRVSAIILAIFAIFILCFVLAHPHLTFATWNSLFQCIWMRWFTLVAALSLFAHAWVGIWTIFTDYLHCAWARSVLMILIILGFLFCLIWVIRILWG